MTSDHQPNATETVYDELLLLRWQSGEVEAMDELVQRWQPRLFQHVRRLVDSADEALEVMQDTWLAMIRSVMRLDDPAKFSAWAYRIASNKAVDFVRRRSRYRTVTLEEPEKIPDRPIRSENEDLTALLQKLSVEHRLVISLRYGEDLPLEAIAESLEIPLGTVKSRLHYALDFLRKQNHEI